MNNNLLTKKLCILLYNFLHHGSEDVVRVVFHEDVLSKVLHQIPLLDPSPGDAPLQCTPVGLDHLSVCAGVWIHKVLRVVHRVMREAQLRQTVVCPPAVPCVPLHQPEHPSPVNQSSPKIYILH